MSGFRTAATLPACVLASLVLMLSTQAVPAFAQGSTGGTLGKTDQSLSGGQPKPGTAAEPKKAKGGAPELRQSGCARIAGTWAWSNGFTVIAHANGTATAHLGGASNRATLTCAGGVYVFTWHGSGFVTRMTASPDAKRLSGSGIVGPESAVRQ